jgi:hypothetical protein
MILDEKIEIVLNGFNIKNYYEKYGDNIKVNQKLFVDIEDISEYSNLKIHCKCEICGFENQITKANYTVNKKNGGFYCCKKCSRLKFKNTCFEKYGVDNVFCDKLIKEKIKNTNIEKYGVSNPFISIIIKEKIKKSNLNKFGKEYYTQTEEYKEKSKSTNLKNLGVEYPMQSSMVKNKSKEKCIEKYGVEYYSKTKECQDKIRNTNIEKYGFPCVLQNEEIKQKVKNTNIEKYGVPYPIQNKSFLNKSLKLKIKPYSETLYYQGRYELDFLNLCNKLEIIDMIKRGPTIKYNDSYVYFPDFLIEKYNLIVEIKSTYTFNLHKEKNEMKKQACINNGYNFLFIIDKDYLNFLNILK